MPLLAIKDYEQAAKSKIDEAFFEYYAGGAADELTLKENRASYGRIKLLPRVLADVSERDMSTNILGQEISFPLIIAPTAMAKMAHPDGEIAIAQAAKNTGLIQCLSTLSNASIQDVSKAGALNWFQLYVYKDRNITEHLVSQAELAGFKAIVLTVDLPVIGLRENIMRSELQLPKGLKLNNFEGIHETEATTVISYVNEQIDPSLSWDDLAWLVSFTKLPVFVKGILRPDDAKKSIDYGAKGIIVSNHGGRQLDTAVTGIDALPNIAAAVEKTTSIIVDGGICRGTDMLKAIALGAHAVMVGRPILWGLAVGGQKGVEAVLETYRQEFDNAMALCGCTTLSAISSDLIF